MTDPIPLRRTPDDFWSGTHTATLHQLIEHVDFCAPRRPREFLRTIRAELHRRGASVEPVPANVAALDDPCVVGPCPICEENPDA